MDSARDICGAIQEVLAAVGRTGVPDTRLRKYIGCHLLAMFYDLGFEDAEIDPMIAHYRRIYPERKHGMTAPFPGVPETLARLGGRKTTATIKSTANTKIVLEQFGLLRHFDHVQGTDGFPAKPEPDVIFHSLEALGVEPRDCLFVGDSAADMEAGRRAGVPTCGARYGYGDVQEMAKWEPDYWIDDLRELA
ncbi:MAG: HAD family hydrolase [Bryobacterales bacterium]|nr:HAD family hydrolase [Bryobacterales bacterium]MBV9400288.1 HAD family hydrolase [Bryobacterales bacterium]